MPFGIGPLEIVIVSSSRCSCSAPSRRPATARPLGRSMREFKGAVTGETKSEEEHEALPQRAA